LVFKAKRVKQQQIIFYELSLEKTDKFNDTIRSTHKAGFPSKQYYIFKLLFLVSGKRQNVLKNAIT